MTGLTDDTRSPRISLLIVLALLLSLGASPAQAALERRAPGGAANPELALPEDGSFAVSASETLLPTAEGARRVVSLAPVRWLDERGDWQSVQASFTADGSGFRTVSDALRCYLPSHGDATFRARLGGRGPELSWTAGAMSVERADGAVVVLAPAPLPVVGRPQGDESVLYSGSWPGVSERYRLEPGLVKHEVVLHHLPAAGPEDVVVFAWTLRLDAPTEGRTRLPSSERSHAIEPDGAGGFHVVDGEGRALLGIPAPYLVEDVDSLRVDLQSGFPGLPDDGDPADEPPSRPLELSWRSEEVVGGLRIELALPMAELLRRIDAFPLVIDPTVVDLQSPCGVLTVYGADRFDLVGERSALVAGDFDGDGAMDLVVAAHRGDGPSNSRSDAGELHLLRGPLGSGSRDLATDKGDALIVGADRADTLGWSVAAGDMNGDGIDDLLVGAPFADGPNNRRSGAGEAHVLLGPFVPGELRDLALLPGDAVLHGGRRSHGAGYAVAVGDVTGDGIDDALVSAIRSDGPQGGRERAGSVHVMVGPIERGPARRVVDLALRSADFTLHGESDNDQLGVSLAAGDLTGDGVDELIVASLSSEGRENARPQAGEVHVLLGPLASGGVVDLAAQSSDAQVFGAASGDLFGHDLAVGDLSGDGVGDLVVGAHLSDGPAGDRDRAGSVAVVFGPFASGMSRDVAAGGADLLVHGAASADFAGWSVAAGDLSGDGRDDLLFGAVAADGPGDSRPGSGELHALLGPFASGLVLDLASRASDLEVQGAGRSDQLGYSVGVTDLDGDGIGDAFGGAKTARGPGETRPAAGEAFVIAGRASGCRSDADCDDGVECTLDLCDVVTGECENDAAPCNEPPSCDVGGDRSSACGGLLLDGLSAEDPDGDELSFRWVSLHPLVSIEPASGTIAAGAGPRALPDAVVQLAATLPACGVDATLVLSVSDGRGGEAACELRVSFSDEQAPTLLNVPPDAVADCDDVPAPANVLALDGCDPDPQLSMVEFREDGDCPNEYALVRTWTAVDACGNASEISQRIEVVDETGPVVRSSSEQLRCLWPPDHRMEHFSDQDFVPSVEDACGGEVSWRFVDCASNQDDDGTGDGSTEPDCVVDEDGRGFSVRAERAGNRLEQRRYKVLVVATDACGNESAPTSIGYIGVSHDRGRLVGSGDCTRASRR